SLGRTLARRAELGDETVKYLREIGFALEDGNLMPPKDLPAVFTNLNRLFLDSAAKSGVKDEDILYPSFLFYRGQITKKGDQFSGAEEVRFIRPGIDPLPPKGEWKLLNTSVQTTAELWESMILQQRMILDPAMFQHDVGHVIDNIERPHYMAAYRDYIRAKQ